ncbi:UGT-49 protein [Aphelenchoides avenae]|nr:UGT-49 protein [Aphelenchus avenae]
MLKAVALVCLLAQLTDGYKILVFSPTMSRSHMIFNARVADALAKDGHNVTLLEVEYGISPDAIETAKHARRLKVYGPFQPTQDTSQFMQAIVDYAFSKQNLFAKVIASYMLPAHHFGPVLAASCEGFIQRKDVIEQLRAEKFDVYMGEQLTLCGSLYSHLLGIKTHVWISSGPMMEFLSDVLGVPVQTSYVPAVTNVDFPDKMTYFQRFTNTLLEAANNYGFRAVHDIETEIFRKYFGSDFPHVYDIVKDSPLTLVNVDELTDFPRPILHNTIFIGGLETSNATAKPLNEPFKSVMEKGKEGVVYISFGSVVPTRYFPDHVRRNIVRAMAELPQYQFILKTEKEDEVTPRLVSKHGNIFTTNWAPQPSILAHPRLRAFVTHGGYNSLLESAGSGVPLLLMGFFGDQERNAALVERNGWGLAFDKFQLTKSHEEFKRAIHRLVSDKR